VRAAGMMGVLTLLSRVLGLVRDMGGAGVFGAGPLVDDTKPLLRTFRQGRAQRRVRAGLQRLPGEQVQAGSGAAFQLFVRDGFSETM